MSAPPTVMVTPEIVAEAITQTMDEEDVAAFAADLFDRLRDRDADMAAAFAVAVGDASGLA